MALIAKSNGGGKDYPPCPGGNHPARCYGVIDLGTQMDGMPGKPPKPTHKVRLMFEIPGETYIFDDKEGPQPYTLSKKFTLSLGEKATLRKDLENWRNKKFTEEELAGFDIGKVLKAPCMLTVVHSEKLKDGAKKVYANIGNISAMPKGLQCGEAVNKPILYSIEDGIGGSFDDLPEWIQEEVKRATEFKVKPPTTHTAEGGNDESPEEEDNEQPF